MKKLLLLTLTSFTLLFVQAQSPCDSLTVSGSQYQLTLTSVGIIDFWETTAPDGTILGQDSSWNMHSVYNISPSGAPYDTITTCLYTMNTVCCIIYIWNGSSWSIPGNSIPSWDCNPNMLGCYDPGTGLGQYTSLAACQAVCVSTVSNLCDSMTLFSTGGSPQTILMAQVLNINTIIASWITTAPDGTVLGVDSMSSSHQIFNNMNNGQPYDTINVCITYADAIGYSTCCVTWIWDANSGLWARMVSMTSIGDIGSFDKKLVKVVDLLGRETSINSNQTLFFIYEDGSIEKKFVIE